MGTASLDQEYGSPTVVIPFSIGLHQPAAMLEEPGPDRIQPLESGLCLPRTPEDSDRQYRRRSVEHCRDGGLRGSIGILRKLAQLGQFLIEDSITGQVDLEMPDEG